MNCKQGDLAFIKKSIRPENIGRVVTCKLCLGFLQQREQFSWHGETWESPDTDYIWVIENSSGISTMYGDSKEAIIADSWLIPIKGDPDEINEEEFGEDLNRILELVEK